jgi:predicted Rossmann fold flavoprotein
MNVYDIAVVGGGAAGTMAAIRASQFNKNIILIEKNAAIGMKILMTGKGRCNITNTASIDTFVERFGKQGNFLRTAFYRFSNQDLVDFFESRGLKLKDERQGRVFPITDKARSITELLQKCLEKAKINSLYNSTLLGIKRKDGLFELNLNGGKMIYSKKVIVATGGLSYTETGSTGDGFRIAKHAGHTITPLRAALVPLRTKEAWVKELQGISLENICITFLTDGKKIISGVGELMFAHFGVSGPLVLDLSGKVVDLLLERKEVKLLIDLKPGLDMAMLEKRLLNDFAKKGSAQLSSVMEGLLPKRMVPTLIRLSKLESTKKASQVTQNQRRVIAHMLKALPLTIAGALSVKSAMVTNGGISTKEINPRTMESKLLPGLYFAGEIIDGAAPSGGYNLQQAFSTGFLAGEEAAHA